MLGSCIYAITNTVNGKRYIGSTKSFKGRIGKHRWELRNNRHGNPHLQNAWNKYGETAFTFRPLVWVDECNLEFYEQRFLDAGWGDYNIGTDARCPMRGQKQSPEHIAKRVAKQRGQKRTPEQCARIGAPHRGKPHPVSAETKEKMRIANKPKSEEHKSKMQAAAARARAAWTGRKHTAESREKIRAASKNRVLTEDQRRRMVEAARKPKSEEHKAKLRAALIGVKHTDERRAAQRAAALISQPLRRERERREREQLNPKTAC
jgi:group I intron endonuclease